MSEIEHIAFVGENSAHDRLLSLLAIVVLISISIVGAYWQFLPLPLVHPEQSEK
jgi:hypothetical protein